MASTSGGRSTSCGRPVGEASGMSCGLAEVGDEVLQVVLVLHPAKGHPGAGDQRARVLKVGFQLRDGPVQPVRGRALHPLGIAEILVPPGLGPEEPVEMRADAVFRALADLVAAFAFAKDLFPGVDVAKLVRGGRKRRQRHQCGR